MYVTGVSIRDASGTALIDYPSFRGIAGENGIASESGSRGTDHIVQPPADVGFHPADIKAYSPLQWV